MSRTVVGRSPTLFVVTGSRLLVAALARPDETHKLLFLVPEQASFQMERAVALRAPGGGYFRAEVLSFSRLARRVFELDLPPSPELWLAGPLAGLALLSLNAWLSSRKVLRASPALTLRDSV